MGDVIFYKHIAPTVHQKRFIGVLVRTKCL